MINYLIFTIYFKKGQMALKHQINTYFFSIKKINKLIQIFGYISLEKNKCSECPETLKTAKKIFLKICSGTGPR